MYKCLFALLCFISPIVNAVGLADCFDSVSMSNGVLCAIKPSTVASTQADDYGYHVVAVPKGVAVGSMVILGGSQGSPYKPSTKSFPLERWLNEAMGQGYMVFQGAYRNDVPVATKCRRKSADCEYQYRHLIMTGIQTCDPRRAKCTLVSGLKLGGAADAENSVFQRISQLSDYVVQKGLQIPSALQTPIDWSKVRVGGHSQGAGHWLLVATDLIKVERVCALAGVKDEPWVWKYNSQKTPENDIRSAVSDEDGGLENILAAWDIWGFNQTLIVDDKSWINGHAAIAKAANHTSTRQWACFS